MLLLLSLLLIIFLTLITNICIGFEDINNKYMYRVCRCFKNKNNNISISFSFVFLKKQTNNNKNSSGNNNKLIGEN
jgi:hypothetical protein